VGGGFFEADAVSNDAGVLCVISTSAIRTRSGNLGNAKANKIRSDALYMSNVSGQWRKVFVITERCMADHFLNEIASKRFPPEIEIVHISLQPTAVVSSYCPPVKKHFQALSLQGWHCQSFLQATFTKILCK
jgi:hypothetical protein